MGMAEGTPPVEAAGNTPPPTEVVPGGPDATAGLAGPPPVEPPKEPAPAAPAAGDQKPPATPPAAAPAPKTPPTAAEPPKPGEPKPVVPGDWPDKWRELAAGDNKAAAKRLERMGSPKDLLNSYLALEQRLSAGDYKKQLPTHYTAEELAEYKKSNGIPDAPDGYDMKIDGMVWGEADKPMLESWSKFAHENNLTPDEMKRGLQWYSREQEATVDRQARADELNRVRGGDALRAEWGSEFTGNLNATRSLYDGASKVEAPNPNEPPSDMWDVVMTARDAYGRRLGDLPTFLKWQSGLSKELNPYATLVPGDSLDPAKSGADRMGELNKMMGDKQSEYWRGGNSAKLQQEWRDLYDAQERAKGGRAA